MEKKRIAILNCLNANDVCAGASCMKALEERRAAFSVYQDQEVLLSAFARCSHCHVHLKNDRGMQEKLERLVSEQVSTVHIGVCATQRNRGTQQVTRCPYMEENEQWLKEHGIEVIWGTH
ncbi:MAG: CGGC domain-containing protein [Lachnospiraceae bacterium]|nr:CGGC domain-containing protein [Lachnospiraceae bacterium]